KPEHRPRPAWLTVYWLVTLLLVVSFTFAFTAAEAVQQYQMRLSLAPKPTGLMLWEQALRSLLQGIGERGWRDEWPGVLVPPLGIIAASPWLSLLSVLTYPASNWPRRV